MSVASLRQSSIVWRTSGWSMGISRSPAGRLSGHATADGNAAAFPWLRAAVVGVVAVALVVAAVLFMRSPQALPRTAALTGTCNGDRALCLPNFIERLGVGEERRLAH